MQNESYKKKSKGTKGRPSKRPGNAELLANAESMSIKQLAILYSAGESSVKRWLHDARGGKRPNKKQRAKATQSAEARPNAQEAANIGYLLAPRESESPADFVKRITGETTIKDDRLNDGLSVDDLIKRRQAILDYVTPAVKALTGRDDLIRLEYVVNVKGDDDIINASIYCRYKTELTDEAKERTKAEREKYGDLYLSYFNEIHVHSDDEYMMLLDLMYMIKSF